MFKKLALLAAFPLALSLVACEQQGETSGTQETTPAATEEGAPADEGAMGTEETGGATGGATEEAAPAEAAPSEAAPAETAPTESAPSEAAPE